jgi:hypothetical protein
VLLCVIFDGKGILADELGSFLIHRLGIEPSTGSSALRFRGLAESLILLTPAIARKAQSEGEG